MLALKALLGKQRKYCALIGARPWHTCTTRRSRLTCLRLCTRKDRSTTTTHASAHRGSALPSNCLCVLGLLSRNVAEQHHATQFDTPGAAIAQYYGVFAVLYALAGSCAQLVMTNSTWTYNHICQLWRVNARDSIFVVFPPCDVKSLKALPEGPRERVALSIGQFRPEKDHELQVGCGDLRRDACASPLLMSIATAACLP